MIYAALLIGLHNSLHLNVTGFSYLTLASSIDLWQRMNGEGARFRERFFNLISFPKILVGPITSANDHRELKAEASVIARLAFFGIFKVFILLNLWREFVPTPLWVQLDVPSDYLYFGTWNYVNLYLEFSGACDLVAALFWLYGFGCPLNFDRPYMAFSVTEFWKRWHITLGLWLKNFVFIPLGGSRVSSGRLYFNLMATMFISGAWHGVSANYIGWGLLQGFFLCVERFVGIENRIRSASIPAKLFYWLVTQTLVTLSWILFFAQI